MRLPQLYVGCTIQDRQVKVNSFSGAVEPPQASRHVGTLITRPPADYGAPFTFSAFSTACWLWNAASPHSGGDAARSTSAPRRSIRALASQPNVSAARTRSCGMEQPTLPQDRGRQRGAKMQALVAGGPGPHNNVRRDRQLSPLRLRLPRLQ